jgi:hypothetical protein
MRCRLEGGPFDGYENALPFTDAPLLIAVRPCPDCGCGHRLHATVIRSCEQVLGEGSFVYWLVVVDEGGALYRHDGLNYTDGVIIETWETVAA